MRECGRAEPFVVDLLVADVGVCRWEGIALFTACYAGHGDGSTANGAVGLIRGAPRTALRSRVEDALQAI